MQLLEDIAIGDIIAVEEGLFQSSVPDADYKVFVDACKKVCDKLKGAEPKFQEKNKKALDTAIKKKTGRVIFRSRRGKMLSGVDYDVPSAAEMSRWLQSALGFKSNNTWIITYGDYGESYRTMELYGNVGETSFIKVELVAYNAGFKTESYSVKIKIRKQLKTDKMFYRMK